MVFFLFREYPFAEKINAVRKKEIAKYRKALYIFSITVDLFASTTKIIVFIILLTFYLANGSMTAEIAFLVLSVFNQTTGLITILIPNCVFSTLNFLTSIRRFNKFLALEESAGDGVCHSSGSTPEFSLLVKNMTACVSRPTSEAEDNPAFGDKEGDKERDNESDKSNGKTVEILKNIDFSCRPGELVIVVGAVGSSKSSLLQAILSELQIKEGHIEVNGRLAYAPQDAWIFSGSIRENILFDSKFDEPKYNAVIRACSLERDLSLFEDGDQTLIGEKGYAISGGQKARISLARALYFDADIYLLDDCLSAVDAHVSKHLFELAITEYLKHKTVVLVTHQLNYINSADKVLFLKNGKQILFEIGQEILKRMAAGQDDDFVKFVGSNLGSEEAQQPRKSLFSAEFIVDDDDVYDDDKEEQNQLKEIKKMEREKRLIEEDDKIYATYRSYVSYLSYGKICLFGPLLILAFGLTQLNATSLDYFLKLWVDINSENSTVVNSLNSTASWLTTTSLQT